MYYDNNEKKIYRLTDKISFRKCSLYHSSNTTHGNCTNFSEISENWKPCYSCNQHGIHLHCTEHPEIEFDTVESSYKSVILRCPKCKKDIEIDNGWDEIISQCLRFLNIEEFKGAKLIRLDDWYVPEVKKKANIESDYWIEANVKTDKDGDTIVVLYVGHKGTKNKSQFFIKPEKCQLTSDHKDADPSKVLSKVGVTLKDRTLSQKYNDL